MKSQLEKNKKQGKSKLIISLVIVALLAAGGLAYYLFLIPEEVEEVTYQTSQVKHGDITLSIENSGVIKNSDQSTIISTINGTISQLYINEDSNVRVNDTVLRVDDRNLNIQLEQAYASKRIAELNLANLLQTTVDNIDNVSVEELSTVTSPIDGVVNYNIKEGVNVNSGNELMNIINNDNMYFKVFVPEEKLNYIDLGDETEIFIYDTYKYVKGDLIRIGNTKYAVNGVLGYDIWIDISNSGINSGMKGYIKIQKNGVFFTLDGIFENSDEASVYSKMSGTIEEIYVESGQYVTKGTPLFKINDTSLSNQIETQKQNIYNDELKIQSILLDLEKTTVKSTKSGVVSELFVEQGQTVGSGAKIANLISDSLVASIEVDELDISQVKVGQEAILLIPGYSEVEEIAGVVSYISDTGKVKDGITTYEVQISFEKNDKVKEGMTVDVAIILDKAENVLKIPTTSIFDNRGVTAVRVLVGEEIVAKEVEIGISDDTMTEIISGLERNEIIITSITYPAGTISNTSSPSSLVPTSVNIPGVTGGGGGGGGGK